MISIMKLHLLVSFLIFVSGCVSVPLSTGSGIQVTVTADPQSVFQQGTTMLYVDVDNSDVKTYYDVSINVFDPGIMKIGQGQCKAEQRELIPNQTLSMRCTLMAPETEYTMQTDVNVKAGFSASLSAVQGIQMMSEEWYRREKITGLRLQPKSYSYKDKNIELVIELSDQPPIVMRKDRKYYLYLTIKNIGSGFVGSIKKEDVQLTGNVILKCNLPEKLVPVGKVFPKIACELLPQTVDSLRSYDIIFNIKYNYDVRDKIRVEVIR